LGGANSFLGAYTALVNGSVVVRFWFWLRFQLRFWLRTRLRFWLR
jgi:hypothetical protein